MVGVARTGVRLRVTVVALLAVLGAYVALLVDAHASVHHAPLPGFAVPGTRSLGPGFRQSIVGETYSGHLVLAVASMPSGQAIEVVGFRDGNGWLCIGAGRGEHANEYAQHCQPSVAPRSANAFGLDTGGTERLTVVVSGQRTVAVPPRSDHLSDPFPCPGSLELPCWLRLVSSPRPITVLPVRTAGRSGNLYPNDVKRVPS